MLLRHDVAHDSVRADDPNGNFPISEVAVATTITPTNRWANTGDLINLGGSTRVNSSTATSRSVRDLTRVQRDRTDVQRIAGDTLGTVV